MKEGGVLVEKFIECSDENGKAVGQGWYSKDGQMVHIETSDRSVANLFESRYDDNLLISKLTFKREKGKVVFSGPFKISKFDELVEGQWIIKMKENHTNIKQ